MPVITRKTKLQKHKSQSLRTTVPMGIAEYINLQPGDTIEWSIDTDSDESIILVKKIETATT